MSREAVRWVMAVAPEMKRADRHVMLEVADHANGKSGEAWPSVATLAEATGYHRGTVKAALRHIEKVLVPHGLRVERGGGRRSNHYVFPELARGRIIRPQGSSGSHKSPARGVALSDPNLPKGRNRDERHFDVALVAGDSSPNGSSPASNGTGLAHHVGRWTEIYEELPDGSVRRRS